MQVQCTQQLTQDKLRANCYLGILLYLPHFLLKITQGKGFDMAPSVMSTKIDLKDSVDIMDLRNDPKQQFYP